MSRVLPIAAAIMVGFTANFAHAADLLPPLPDLDKPLIGDRPLGTGWYLRGDVGIGSTKIGSAVSEDAPGTRDHTNRRMGSAMSLGAGAGYQFNSWLRADVTIDHRFDARYRGRTRDGGADWHHQGQLSATTVLANAYLDLGTWYAFTPYIGAGLGFSSKRLNQYEITSGGATVATLPGRNRNDFAWALMAGVAIDTGANTSLDLGYRYLNLHNAGTAATAGHGSVSLRKIESHEFRAGLRWQFGN
jgi:opacity protein-like surface antigen